MSKKLSLFSSDGREIGLVDLTGFPYAQEAHWEFVGDKPCLRVIEVIPLGEGSPVAAIPRSPGEPKVEKVSTCKPFTEDAQKPFVETQERTCTNEQVSGPWRQSWAELSEFDSPPLPSASTFKVGDKVRVRDDHPKSAYRGKVGVVVCDEFVEPAVQMEDGKVFMFCPSDLALADPVPATLPNPDTLRVLKLEAQLKTEIIMHHELQRQLDLAKRGLSPTADHTHCKTCGSVMVPSDDGVRWHCPNYCER